MKKFLIATTLLGNIFQITAAEGNITRSTIIISSIVRFVRTIRSMNLKNPVSFNPFANPYDENATFVEVIHDELRKAGKKKITIDILIKALARFYPSANIAAHILNLVDTPSFAINPHAKVSRPAMPPAPPKKFVIPLMRTYNIGPSCTIPADSDFLLSIPLGLTPEEFALITSPLPEKK